MPNLFETLGPDATVCVLPRYLAGSGPPDLRTAWPFPFDEDWTLHQPEEGTAVASSPCLRLRAGYVTAPGSPGRAQWITAAHKDPFGPATWQITFDSSTPVELVHDAHAALLDLYREGRDSFSNALFRYSLTQYGAYAPLLARGWSHVVDTGGTQFFTAPDDACGLEHSYAPSSPPESPDPVWKAWGGHWENPHWTAQFTRLTPTDVVTAFTTSLLSAEPVERTMKDIPHRSRYAVKIAAATTPAPNRLPAPVATPLPRPATNRTR
ncbi:MULTISPECIES: DUF317 domain-containing protein [Streptomyces]|uniref:DUF317 domain-containing protein n=1 Tax=Streptomyces eurythermus TaxID=42237 RepID=A0ABW6Z5R3_9ACTN|nr:MULTISPECIES: DUF317 domain-containing protein [Streptomyces]QIS75053.1 DUF317 domain-containing protein [Streptomyces sp. DSM 40868]